MFTFLFSPASVFRLWMWKNKSGKLSVRLFRHPILIFNSSCDCPQIIMAWLRFYLAFLLYRYQNRRIRNYRILNDLKVFADLKSCDQSTVTTSHRSRDFACSPHVRIQRTLDIGRLVLVQSGRISLILSCSCQ